MFKAFSAGRLRVGVLGELALLIDLTAENRLATNGQAVRDAIAGLPAPIVNVTPPAVNVAAPVVHVAVPEAPVPQVTVRVPPEGEKEQIVKRDNKGEIISILTRRVSERR